MVAVVVAPVIALTTAGTVALALGALAALVYGDRSDMTIAAGGAALVFAELEHVWSADRETLELAAAVAGFALFAASELRDWSRRIGEAAPAQGALGAHAAALGARLLAVGLVLALFVVLARGLVHEPLLGVVGAVAAVAVFAAVLVQARLIVRA